MGPAFPTVTVINARAQTRKRVNLGLPAQPAGAQVCSHISLHDLLCCDDCHMIFFLDSVALLSGVPADCGEEKEDGTFTGAEELFGTTSESDTSTFHGFEDDELEEPAANGNGIPGRHR